MRSLVTEMPKNLFFGSNFGQRKRMFGAKISLFGCGSVVTPPPAPILGVPVWHMVGDGAENPQSNWMPEDHVF